MEVVPGIDIDRNRVRDIDIHTHMSDVCVYIYIYVCKTMYVYNGCKKSQHVGQEFKV